MGVTLHKVLGCRPGQIYDGALAVFGRRVVDLAKLEKRIKPRDGESIADATARVYGVHAVLEVVENLRKGGVDEDVQNKTDAT